MQISIKVAEGLVEKYFSVSSLDFWVEGGTF